MSTTIDSNMLIALSNEDDTLNTQARSALENAPGRGNVVKNPKNFYFREHRLINPALDSVVALKLFAYSCPFMTSTKYIGLDVHKEGIPIAVMNSFG